MKTTGQTLATGRPFPNKVGTYAGFRTNRTQIEVTTEPCDVMETSTERPLTLVDELSKKCRVQEDPITGPKNNVWNARGGILMNQGGIPKQLVCMTAKDVTIREIEALVEKSPETPTKQHTIYARPNVQVPRLTILRNNFATEDIEERMKGVDCGGSGQSRNAP
jgi:hypothetical protein